MILIIGVYQFYFWCQRNYLKTPRELMGTTALVFLVLIALSCLFIKQHCLLDLPAGPFLGWLTYQGYGAHA